MLDWTLGANLIVWNPNIWILVILVCESSSNLPFGKMNDCLEVITSFYEFKNIILHLLTEKLASKFDTCLKSFRQSLKKDQECNPTTDNGHPQNDSLKRFDTIREETMHDLSALIDSKLTHILEQFLNQDKVAKRSNLSWTRSSAKI